MATRVDNSYNGMNSCLERTSHWGAASAPPSLQPLPYWGFARAQVYIPTPKKIKPKDSVICNVGTKSVRDLHLAFSPTAFIGISVECASQVRLA